MRGLPTCLLLCLAQGICFGQAFTFRDAALVGTAGAKAATPAMTFSDLANFNNTLNQTSYATGAYQPTANALVLAVVCNSKGAAVDTPTFSGNGLTWVQVANTNCFGGTLAITIFRALGAAPTSTVGTADFGANTETGCHIRVVQFASADTSGANGSGAIVQSVVASVTSAAVNPAWSMAALTGTKNAVWAVVTYNVASATFAGSPEAGWTQDFTASYATPLQGIYGVYQLATTDNTIAITGTSSVWGGISVEIKQAP